MLAGCSDDGDATSTDTGAPQSEATTSFNDADVTFAQQKIPHHQQAVEMAELAGERASTDQVRQVAAAIEEAQGPEIETMTGWLEAWGRTYPKACTTWIFREGRRWV